MAMSLSRGLSPEAVWDLLHSAVVNPYSIGALVKDEIMDKLHFFDSFNRTAADANIWTPGGDGGTFLAQQGPLYPTLWTLTTGNVANNDWYIHGGANIENKRFTPSEDGLEEVTWGARLQFPTLSSIQAFFGLVLTAIIDYAEPAAQCAHFFIDSTIGVNYMARSWMAAEEQTDTGIAYDADMHDFRIEWSVAAILFYIDDVLVATHAAQVPTYPMLTEFLVRTLAAAQRFMRIDKNYVELG